MQSKITLFIIFLSQLLSAQDLQWMIRDGELRSGMNYTATTNSYPTFVGLVGKPNIDVHNNASNSFFIIYMNGDYFLSPEPIFNLNKANTDAPNINDSLFYKFDRDISFLYLTNGYEDDDPPESISVVDTLTSPTQVEDVIITNSDINNAGPRLTNHDLVNGKDITFIFDGTLIQEGCSYTLSHDIERDLILDKSPFKIGDSKNVAVKRPIGIGFQEAEWDGVGLSLPSNIIGTNAFLNYTASFPDSIAGDSVTFRLTGKQSENNPSGCTNSEWSINLSDRYHDPNYIELKCVWEEGDNKYGIYRVECFNDGAGAVNDVRLSAVLPSSAIASSVEILSWRAKCKKGCGEVNDKLKRIPNSDTSLIEVKFLNGLQGYGGKKSCRNTAWFEFKVEFASNTDLIFDNLEATSPMSHFESTPYQIVTFYDHKTCYDQNDTLILGNNNVNTSLKCMPGRVINNCYSPCQITFCDRIKGWFCID